MLSGYINSFIGALGSMYHYYTQVETIEPITIRDQHLKIPYLHDDKRYYMMVPLHAYFEEQIQTMSGLLEKQTNNDIYLNSVLECVVKINDHDEPIDITDEVERYMGPDQLYRTNGHIIRVRNIVPTQYHGRFEYVRILTDTMEYTTRTQLDHLFFEENDNIGEWD